MGSLTDGAIRRSIKDVELTGVDGDKVTLPGRSLMLVRNVGHLMTNPAITDKDGKSYPPEEFDKLLAA